MKDVNYLIGNGVNVEKSLELFGDMETYNDTLGEFLVGVHEKLNQIKEYKESGDMANYAILVHSLKSDARYFGFEKLAELSYQHEMESKANNIYFITENYDKLVEEANKIINIVQNYMGDTDTIKTEIEKPSVVVKEKTILVVDDSNVVVNYIKRIFSDVYEVMVANDGKEALDIISNNLDGKIIAVLLDLNMPNVDGFQVLEYFKENNIFTKIPVSIITGNDFKDMIDKAFKYPIVDVLSKPFNEVNVRTLVEKTINSNK